MLGTLAGCLLVFTARVPLCRRWRRRARLTRCMDQAFAVQRFRQTAISPDGKRVAWVESLKAANGAPNGDAAIYVAAAERSDGREADQRRAAGAQHHEHDIAWSPDGRELAFLSDAESSGQLQLYVANAGSGSARQLTHLAGLSERSEVVAGRQDAGAAVHRERAPRGRAAGRHGAGGGRDRGKDLRTAADDGERGGRQRAKPISPPDMYVYEYDWSPDGKTFAATAAHGSGDNNWWIAQLYTLPATGGEMKSILQPPLQINMPRWSPDGRSIAYISGLMSDFGAIGGDIYTVPAGWRRGAQPDARHEGLGVVDRVAGVGKNSGGGDCRRSIRYCHGRSRRRHGQHAVDRGGDGARPADGVRRRRWRATAPRRR